LHIVPLVPHTQNRVAIILAMVHSNLRRRIQPSENHRYFKSTCHCTNRSSVLEYFVYHAGTGVAILFHTARSDSLPKRSYMERPSTWDR